MDGPNVWNAISLVLGGLLTLLVTSVTQRTTYVRERDADRRNRLLDAYAEWAASVDRQFTRLRYTAMRGHGGGLSGEQLAERKLEMSKLWDEIREADVKLRTLKYRLILLEPSGDRRALVTQISKTVMFWDQSFEVWQEFSQGVVATDGELAPPYKKDLETLMDDLSNTAALQ